MCALSGFSFSAAALEAHPGEQTYAQHCAACHDNKEDPQARSLQTLRTMIPALIEHALTDGRMKAQGSVLSVEQRDQLIAFLAGSVQGSSEWEHTLACKADKQRVDVNAQVKVATFGINHQNHRNLEQQAGLHKADLENLELAWALAFPNITMMRSQPAVVGNTMFISPVESKKVYAFNIESQPCLQWVHSSDRVLRTSLTFGKRSDGKRVLVFGDMEASIHMLDAANGELLWRTDLKRFPESIITGTPQLVGDRVYASVSQFEIMIGHQSEHECCKASGAVAALNATNGDVVWLTPTLPEAKPVRDRGDGQMIWGPSGAPVWTSPAIDLKRGLLYVGTGEANSEPAHKHTDAILAIDLKSGEVQWSFQASANDIFLAGCWREESLNCPPEYSINRDVDFGASVIIAQRSDGSDVLLAGQKSSVVWALDPDDQGRVLWRWSYGQGTANGGIHWAMAIDDGKVYAPISDPGRPRPGFEPVPGLYALDIDSGDLVWQHRTYPDCDGREQKAPRCQFLYGFSAAPIVVDGAVVTGSLDGYLRIFDGDDGRLMFTYDTIREFQTVN
ncbi:MAG: polyvinyl alcohol dehydrogenase (cytochrome), partial [Limisphaerales bacterium]